MSNPVVSGTSAVEANGNLHVYTPPNITTILDYGKPTTVANTANIPNGKWIVTVTKAGVVNNTGGNITVYPAV